MPTATPIPPLSHPTTVIALNLARLAAMDPSHPHLTRLVGRRRALSAFSAFTRAMPPAALLTLTDQALYAALISHLAGIRFLARATASQRIAAPPRPSQAAKNHILATYGKGETSAHIARHLNLTRNTVICIANRARAKGQAAFI